MQVTETWLRDASDHTDISGDNFVHNPRKDRTGGSVDLFSADNCDFQCRPEVVFFALNVLSLCLLKLIGRNRKV